MWIKHCFVSEKTIWLLLESCTQHCTSEGTRINHVLIFQLISQNDGLGLTVTWVSNGLGTPKRLFYIDINTKLSCHILLPYIVMSQGRNRCIDVEMLERIFDEMQKDAE